MADPTLADIDRLIARYSAPPFGPGTPSILEALHATRADLLKPPSLLQRLRSWLGARSAA